LLEDGLSPFLVVPEIIGSSLFFQRIYFISPLFEVKDNLAACRFYGDIPLNPNL
jgi:hypothetical protein